MRCPICGTLIERDATYCKKCGTRMAVPKEIDWSFLDLDNSFVRETIVKQDEKKSATPSYFSQEEYRNEEEKNDIGEKSEEPSKKEKISKKKGSKKILKKPEHPNDKKSFIIILLICFFIGASAIGYRYYRKSEAEKFLKGESVSAEQKNTEEISIETSMEETAESALIGEQKEEIEEEKKEENREKTEEQKKKEEEEQVQTVIVDDITYEIKEKTASLVKCNSSASKIELPSTIGNAPLTTIGPKAFAGCEHLKAIDLAEGCKTIKEGAFQGCQLSKIVLPDSLSLIEDHVFDSEVTIICHPDTYAKSFAEKYYVNSVDGDSLPESE